MERKKQTRREFLRWSAFVAATAALSACAPATPAPEPTKAEATPAPAEPTTAPAAEAVEVEFMTGTPAEQPSQRLLQELTDKYNAAHPSVKITWNCVGWENHTQMLRARIESGKPPDATSGAASMLAGFARQGILQLDDGALKEKNYAGDATWADTFLSGLLEQSYVADAPDGAGYYSIPQECNIRVVFYNVAIFEQQGITPPKTWAELMAACEKLKAAGIIPFAQDGGFPEYTYAIFGYIFCRIGGEDAFYNTVMHKEGTSWVNNPDWLLAAQEMQKIAGYFQPGFLGSQWPTAQLEWTQGRMAMEVCGSWLISEVKEPAPEGFRLDFFRFPAYEGGKGDQTATDINHNGYGILKGAKHPKEALDFLKYLTSPEAQKVSSALQPTMPVIAGVDFPAELAKAKEIVTTSKMMRFAAGTEEDAGEWEANIAEPLIGRLCTNELTPEKFLEELQAQSDAYYAKKQQ